MKILFWTDGFWPRMGGIETQALQFVEEMQRRGHLCTVIAQKDTLIDPVYETYRGIVIWRLDFNSNIPRKDLKWIRSIQDCLKEFQPDLIHLNVCDGWSAFAFLLLKSAFQVPIVLTVHAPFFYGAIKSPLISRIVSSVNAVGCVSKWVLQELEKLVPAAKNKCKLIYNGLALPTLSPSLPSFTPPTFLLLGRFTSEKGFATAIKAFALLKQRGSSARLWIAGAGEERCSLERLVDIVGLRDEAPFIGEVKREDVPSLISRATCVLVPSYFETFGLVTLEAMQMQRSVIASRVGGIPEVLLDQETGLLVPPQDPIALANAMEKLLAQPERMIRMGIEGRKRAMENFTLHKNGSEYETLYNILVL